MVELGVFRSLASSISSSQRRGHLEVRHYEFLLMMLLVVIVTASVIDYMKGYALSNYPVCTYPEPLDECIERYGYTPP